MTPTSGQAEQLFRVLKVDKSMKSVDTPGVKVTRRQLEDDEAQLRENTSPYRVVAIRTNYLSADQPKHLKLWQLNHWEKHVVCN